MVPGAWAPLSLWRRDCHGLKSPLPSSPGTFRLWFSGLPREQQGGGELAQLKCPTHSQGLEGGGSWPLCEWEIRAGFLERSDWFLPWLRLIWGFGGCLRVATRDLVSLPAEESPLPQTWDCGLLGLGCGPAGPAWFPEGPQVSAGPSATFEFCPEAGVDQMIFLGGSVWMRGPQGTSLCLGAGLAGRGPKRRGPRVPEKLTPSGRHPVSRPQPALAQHSKLVRYPVSPCPSAPSVTRRCTSHEGKPYCNHPCYSAMFGPKGFGRGGAESHTFK
nr:cysteine-rich protein 1 isoform X1 [Marmota flaviventris]